MDAFQVKNHRQYVSNYAALARALGSTRAQPHESEQALVAAIKSRVYHWGSLCRDDMFFLAAMLSILQPRLAVEIGTASGSSAALLAQAIARGYAERGEALPDTLLHTIDRKAECLFDGTKPIGFAVAEVVPELVSRVKIHTLGDSSLATSLVGAQTLGFAFIDGNHQHPWPLIDLLHLLPLMETGGWIVLDDINQPDYHPDADARYGPRLVYEAWPAARLANMNVGAIQIPTDRQTLQAPLEALLNQPFEVSETGWKRYRAQVSSLLALLSPSQASSIAS